ncbi:MAG: hypothetical protein GF405_03215 [Candidatus Eisenbacteria bacterium]|nr:hypothetical protein [Candidatus Eisenbacteria bacterium]
MSTRWFTYCFTLVTLIAVLAGCSGGGGGETVALGGPERVTIEQVERWLAEGRTLVLIDSRSDVAWERGSTKAEGAIRVPPGDVDSVIEQIPTEGTLIVYCT